MLPVPPKSSETRAIMLLISRDSDGHAIFFLRYALDAMATAELPNPEWRRLSRHHTSGGQWRPSFTPVSETADPAPLSPYGRSKLMSEYMLVDARAAYNLRYVTLRYFNVAGADPAGRLGQSTPGATHLIKAALETALRRRSYMSIYGSDYPTPDGTCVRDYVHVSDLARAHLAALDHLRDGGGSRTLNCGYGRGYSVREVVDAVRRVTGGDFEIRQAP